MSNKISAVEWLIEQLRMLAHNPKTHLGMGDIRVTQGYIDEIEEQAKQIYKEQIKELFWNGENPDKPGLYICDLGPYRGVQLGHWDGDDWLFDGNIIRQVGGWISSPKYKQQDK